MVHLRGLIHQLLCIVLAKVAVAGVVELADEGGGLRLANGYDADGLRRASRPLRRLPHPVENRPQRCCRRAFRYDRPSGHSPFAFRLLSATDLENREIGRGVVF